MVGVWRGARLLSGGLWCQNLNRRSRRAQPAAVAAATTTPHAGAGDSDAGVAIRVAAARRELVVRVSADSDDPLKLDGLGNSDSRGAAR